MRETLRRSAKLRAKKPAPAAPTPDQIVQLIKRLWTLVATKEAQKVDGELEHLLQSLGVDPANPTAWRDGFLILACLHHGVGRPRRTNENAKKLSVDDDFVLLCEMSRLEKQGLTPEQAIEKLASDQTKADLFKFKATSSNAQRAEVLRKRLNKIIDSGVGWEALCGNLTRTTVEEVLTNLVMGEVLAATEKRNAILGCS
jgi:hypothetical protein